MKLRIRCIFIFIVLCTTAGISQGVILGREEQRILTNIINEFDKDPINDRFDHVIQTGLTKWQVLPKVFIWCPLKHFRMDVYCPVHKTPLSFHSWCDDVEKRNSNEPRLVYDLHGNIILVQSLYRCPFNIPDHQSQAGHIYRSASVEILENIPKAIENRFPFKLHYRSACSQELLDYLVVHIGRGQNFLELTEDIMSMHFRKFSQCTSNCDSIDLNGFYTSPVYSTPSNDQLMHIFLAYYNSVRSIIQSEILSTPCSVLTCDHTFKVSKHIGVTRSEDSVFVNQFENLFIGLNENGEVVMWRLTKNTSFREIEYLLKEFKDRLFARKDSLRMVVVDDCCSIRASYKSIFPDVVVKLDLYHACQRFVKTLKKGLTKSQQLSKEFGLIFRGNGDTGAERGMETPDEETIESNLEMFLKKWEAQLSDASMESIRNLRKHITKGCCSAIPAGVGTQRNERLHKSLKRSLLGGASTLSPKLAVAVFSIVLYVWSCKRKPGARKHTSNARVIPVVPIELLDTNKASQDTSHVLAFNSGTSPTELPSTMKRHSKAACALSDLTLDNLHTNEAVEISELKNDSVLALVISRVIHLKEVFSSIDNMRITRDLNIYEFPFANKRSLINVNEFARLKEEDCSLESGMNNECLRRNLASFGLTVDPVPGNGDCCFNSIVKQIHKLVLDKDDGNNTEFRKHLQQNLGFKTSVAENTDLLRSLFCREIEENVESYKIWVDFDINEEVSKFSESGWFNSSLGDLCVLACSNLLQTSIVVITSIPAAPFIPFVPTTVCSKTALFIAYNHSGPGHYDATQG